MRAHHDPGAERLDAASEPPDLLSEVLRSVALAGSISFLVEATTPWITRAPAARTFAALLLPREQHLVSFHVVTAGSCWGGLEGQPAQRLEAGDVLLVPHGAPYRLADPDPARADDASYDPLSFFRRMAAGELPTVVHEGGGGAPRTSFVCSFLGCDRRPCNPVLDVLPEVVVLRAAAAPGERIGQLLGLVLHELNEPGAGGREVLRRLSELMFVEVARRCLETLPADRPGWLAGLRDPLVARALARLHREPARDWTTETLAQAVGSSRSLLAERFAQRLGQPPMRYLASWRMQLAARQLADPAVRVKRVAEAAGYDSEAGFSRAFKRLVGVAPSRWRAGGR